MKFKMMLIVLLFFLQGQAQVSFQTGNIPSTTLGSFNRENWVETLAIKEYINGYVIVGSVERDYTIVGGNPIPQERQIYAARTNADGEIDPNNPDCWIKYLGEQEKFYNGINILIDEENDIVVLANQFNQITNFNPSSILLIKLDGNGSIIKHNEITNIRAHDIIPVYDGGGSPDGYAIAGVSIKEVYSGDPNNPYKEWNLSAIRVTNDLDLSSASNYWTTTISSDNTDHFINSIAQAGHGGDIVCLTSYKFLYRLNYSNGQLKPPTTNINLNPNLDPIIMLNPIIPPVGSDGIDGGKIISTSDGGFIIGLGHEVNGNPQNNPGASDELFVLKTNGNLESEWNTYYDNVYQNTNVLATTYVHDIKETDNSFVFFLSASPDIILFETSKSYNGGIPIRVSKIPTDLGNDVFDPSKESSATKEFMLQHSFDYTSDKGFVLAHGYHDTYSSTNKPTQQNAHRINVIKANGNLRTGADNCESYIGHTIYCAQEGMYGIPNDPFTWCLGLIAKKASLKQHSYEEDVNPIVSISKPMESEVKCTKKACDLTVSIPSPVICPNYGSINGPSLAKITTIPNNPNWTYQWSTGDVDNEIVVDPSQVFSVSVIVTDEFGCSDMASIDASAFSLAANPLSGNSIHAVGPFCEDLLGVLAPLSLTNGYPASGTYTWSGTGVQQSGPIWEINTNGLLAGSYPINYTYADDFNCYWDLNSSYDVFEPQNTSGADEEFCLNSPSTTYALQAGDIFYLNGVVSSPTIDPSNMSPGVYHAKICGTNPPSTCLDCHEWDVHILPSTANLLPNNAALLLNTNGPYTTGTPVTWIAPSDFTPSWNSSNQGFWSVSPNTATINNVPTFLSNTPGVYQISYTIMGDDANSNRIPKPRACQTETQSIIVVNP